MNKEKRELLFQARIYRLLAIIFVFTGIFIFIALYLQNVEGRLLQALSEPATVIMIVFPFVPAIILSILAKSSENKYLSYKSTKKK